MCPPKRKEIRPERRGFNTQSLRLKTEIPKQVRDDKKTGSESSCHAKPWTDENQGCFSI